MTCADGLSERDRIREVLEGINRAWVEGRVRELETYFHEDMVIVGPDLRVLGHGREACIRSYEEFVRQAAVAEFGEEGFEIGVWGHAAVASYRFEICYEVGGKTLRESGRDLFVLAREDDRWRAVWRMVLPSLSEA